MYFQSISPTLLRHLKVIDFHNVHVAHQANQVLKINLAMYDFSYVWCKFENNTRFTGIHSVDEHGQIKPLSGMNLDEEEWSALIDNSH